MPPKNPLSLGDRQRENERLVLSNDASALRRGRRGAPRTQVLRPALLWLPGDEDRKVQCVVLDLNPQGMKLRSLEAVAEGSRAVVQLMRDEAFTLPLSQPLNVEVVRLSQEVAGFYDHGVRVVAAAIKKPPAQQAISIPRPITPPRKPPARRVTPLDLSPDLRKRGI